jgi:hypothetical protein
MSILGKIFGRIFPNAHAGEPLGSAPVTPRAQPTPQTPSAPHPTGTAATAAMNQVDVEAMLDGLAAKKSEKLNWRTSIVDLMKLLDLDSSLQERKELADELKYSGDKSDSAAMNVWLHKQVMNKLAQNGGKVPADLKD